MYVVDYRNDLDKLKKSNSEFKIIEETRQQYYKYMRKKTSIGVEAIKYSNHLIKIQYVVDVPKITLKRSRFEKFLLAYLRKKSFCITHIFPELCLIYRVFREHPEGCIKNNMIHNCNPYYRISCANNLNYLKLEFIRTMVQFMNHITRVRHFTNDFVWNFFVFLNWIARLVKFIKYAFLKKDEGVIVWQTN